MSNNKDQKKAFGSITVNNNMFDYTDNFKSNYDERLPQFNSVINFNNNTLNNMQSNTINENPNYPVRQVPGFDEFIQHRNPSLNVGMSALPVPNPTILPNQLQNSLDLLAQTNQLSISNMNKRSNMLDNSKIINSNEIDEQYEKIQGIADPFTPYNQFENPSAYFNNFNGEGRSDIIREYICHINSIDRDINKYPNPFNFLVKFAPGPTDTGASISRNFENIRYVKVETAVLPRKYFVIKTKLNYNDPEIVNLFNIFNLPSSNQIIDNKFVIIYSSSNSINYTDYNSDIAIPVLICYECINNNGIYTTYKYEMSNMSLENDKYSILYLNDINDVSQFSTDLALSKAFNVLYPDAVYGDSLYIDCRYADKIYKYSNLGNMTRMMLRITNSMGKDLTTNLIAQDFDVPSINSTTCTCITDNYGNISRDYTCICNYIRHPRYVKNQLDLMFKFGIVETDFDIRAFN